MTRHNDRPGVRPKWIPFPPRALDGKGNAVEIAASQPLGSYEVRFEYVCLNANGCSCGGSHRTAAAAAPATASIRMAKFSLHGDGGKASFAPIPQSMLVPTQSDAEIARRALRKSLESGWGTFDHSSSLSKVLLPDSFKVGVAFYQKSTGRIFGPAGLTLFRNGMTVADPTIDYAGGFTLRLGMHSVDQTFTEAWLCWNTLCVYICVRVCVGGLMHRCIALLWGLHAICKQGKLHLGNTGRAPSATVLKGVPSLLCYNYASDIPFLTAFYPLLGM